MQVQVEFQESMTAPSQQHSIPNIATRGVRAGARVRVRVRVRVMVRVRCLLIQPTLTAPPLAAIRIPITPLRTLSRAFLGLLGPFVCSRGYGYAYTRPLGPLWIGVEIRALLGSELGLRLGPYCITITPTASKGGSELGLRLGQGVRPEYNQGKVYGLSWLGLGVGLRTPASKIGEALDLTITLPLDLSQEHSFVIET